MAAFLNLWVWVTIASAGICAALVFGSLWRGGPGGLPTLNDPTPAADPVPGAPWSFAAEWLDLETEVREALHRATPAAARLGVELAGAAPPGLAVRTDRRTLGTALAALLEHAIAASPCGKVMLTARREGPVVELAVLDDGAAIDPASRRAALRPVESAIGLQGGSLEITAAAGEGTTVRLRLPAPVGRPQTNTGGAALPDAPAPSAVSMTAG